MTSKDWALLQELSSASITRLCDRARKAQVPADDLTEALEEAPQKHKLVQLVFQHECSELRRRLTQLYSMPLTDLHSTAKTSGVEPSAIDASLDHPLHPKQQLIKLIIEHESDGPSEQNQIRKDA